MSVDGCMHSHQTGGVQDRCSCCIVAIAACRARPMVERVLPWHIQEQTEETNLLPDLFTAGRLGGTTFSLISPLHYISNVE